MRTRAAVAESTASTGVTCDKQVQPDSVGLKASCGPVRRGDPLISMNMEGMGQVALEAHPEGQKGDRKG